MQQIKTAWTVFTGAPCSGKTSVLEALGQQGYPTRREFARAYFTDELAKGRTLQDICADQHALQEHFLLGGLEGDASLDPEKPYILDRSPVDAVAHYMLYGFPYDDALQKAARDQYARVFFFSALSFVKDPVRAEDEHMAAKLDTYFRASYELLGYKIIDVPFLSVEERMQFVLDHIHE